MLSHKLYKMYITIVFYNVLLAVYSLQFMFETHNGKINSITIIIL